MKSTVMLTGCLIAMMAATPGSAQDKPAATRSAQDKPAAPFASHIDSNRLDSRLKTMRVSGQLDAVKRETEELKLDVDAQTATPKHEASRPPRATVPVETDQRRDKTRRIAAGE